MSKEIWFNLPVKDVNKSRDFFRSIGFNINENHNSENMAAVSFGDGKSMVMLFPDAVLEGFAHNKITDTAQSNETMISFGADTKEEVDATAEKVRAAGGNIFSEPSEIQGWMYGFAFTDPDGHRWNMLYMDMGKMPR